MCLEIRSKTVAIYSSINFLSKCKLLKKLLLSRKTLKRVLDHMIQISSLTCELIFNPLLGVRYFHILFFLQLVIHNH